MMLGEIYRAGYWNIKGDMMKLYEVAFGSVSNRNIIVNQTELNIYHKQALAQRRELYRSVYYYDEKIIQHLALRKSIKGYIGICGLEKIIFDFDKDNLSDETLLLKVRDFVTQLIDEWKLPKESVNPWYSGTGYHITAPDFFKFTSSQSLPEVIKATLSVYFKDIDLSIYDPMSIIRVGNTINPKVRRYKVLLKLSELYKLSAEEIIKISEKNRKIPISKFDMEEVTLFNEKIVNPKPKAITSTGDFLTNKVTCVQKMYFNGPKKGTRHLIILRMTSSWRRAGVPEPAIVASLKTWTPDMDTYEIEKVVRNVFEANNNDGYNFGCTDEFMTKFCDERCVFYKSKNLVPEMLDHVDMEKNFVKFMRSDYENKSMDLMKLIGVPGKSHIIIPGENILFFGDTGLGKTALAQNIAINADHLKVLYGNFEFTTNLLYRRFVQIKNYMSKQEVMNHYIINDNSLSKGLEHIKIIDNTVDVKNLYQVVESYEPGLLILDTLKKIRTSDKNDFAKDITLSNLFKKLAKDYNMIVMAINHIPKLAGSDGKGNPRKLNMHSGKGASDLEDMSDHVLIIEGREDNDLRTIKAGKARDESKFNLPFTYEWNTFTFKYIGS